MKKPSRYELEWKLVYSILVAGKTASFADQKTRALCGYATGAALRQSWLMTPFERFRAWLDGPPGRILAELRNARAGNYAKNAKAFTWLATHSLDLATCDAPALEACPGIGPKTARFFLLWTRPDSVECAALDTHVMKWLRMLGHTKLKGTPGNPKEYARLEAIFIREAKVRKMTPRDLDAFIWDFCQAQTTETGRALPTDPNIWPTPLRPVSISYETRLDDRVRVASTAAVGVAKSTAPIVGRSRLRR